MLSDTLILSNLTLRPNGAHYYLANIVKILVPVEPVGGDLDEIEQFLFWIQQICSYFDSPELALVPVVLQGS
jgi:hypothetical protein